VPSPAQCRHQKRIGIGIFNAHWNSPQLKNAANVGGSRVKKLWKNRRGKQNCHHRFVVAVDWRGAFFGNFFVIPDNAVAEANSRATWRLKF
jgi:hypothetical protein